MTDTKKNISGSSKKSSSRREKFDKMFICRLRNLDSCEMQTVGTKRERNLTLSQALILFSHLELVLSFWCMGEKKKKESEKSIAVGQYCKKKRFKEW